MILIADSGSTKCHWAACGQGGDVARINTRGMNPYACDDAHMASVLDTELLPQIGDRHVDELHFYGAGCIFQGAERVGRALKERFPQARIEVESDMLGAARALYGERSGIACILGTGSNSCLYDGRRILRNVPPLGYILGDEGSGAHIGRLVAADLLKGLMPDDLAETFYRECRTSYAEIIECVYRRPGANRYLAGFAEFAARHIDRPQIASCVDRAFDSFIERNVMQYDTRGVETGFIGSIAHHFRRQLTMAVERHGLTAGGIMPSPIDALAAYHTRRR